VGAPIAVKLESSQKGSGGRGRPLFRKLRSVRVPALFPELRSKPGKLRNLGTFKSRAAAESPNRAVQYFKSATDSRVRPYFRSCRTSGAGVRRGLADSPLSFSFSSIAAVQTGTLPDARLGLDNGRYPRGLQHGLQSGIRARPRVFSTKPRRRPNCRSSSIGSIRITVRSDKSFVAYDVIIPTACGIVGSR